MLKVYIIVRYHSPAGIVTQGGTFPLTNRNTPEYVAYEWIQQIKREVHHYDRLIEVIVNGDQDITDKVKKLEDNLSINNCI
ncbi:hypothetical protein AB1K84_18445 [Mesobacillus foraminis]|uniref:hypothetical protein n=1 Tax=Mesobacillus foraminis TaxID=279826 RepID=UPI00399FDBF7